MAKESPMMSNQRKYLFSLVLFTLVVISIATVVGFKRTQNQDSLEHIHSAWYIEQGYVPGKDFYQHHNPLLWYLMALVIKIFGETMLTFYILNYIFIFLVLGIGAMVFLITWQLTNKLEVCCLSLIFLFSFSLFYESVFDLRPDVPMLLFGLLAVWFFILFLQSGSAISICLSGLSFGISFLFLQKVIFLLFAVSIVLGFLIIKKKADWKTFLYFMLSLSLPLSFLLIYLIMTDSVQNYFLTNWLLNNSASSDKYSPFTHMSSDKRRSVFWLVSVPSFLFALFNKKTTFELKVVCFLALVMFLSLFIYKHPYNQYFYFAISFLSIICGCTVVYVFDLFSAAFIFRMAIIFVISFFPVKKMIKTALLSKDYMQLERIEFVMNNTSQKDCVYDARPEFNLFCHDLHYFWYSTKETRGLGRYNRLTNNRYGDYNAYKLILEKKPKFISDYLLDVNNPVITENYKPTQFTGLYMRKK
jgi:hypothetical protein